MINLRKIIHSRDLYPKVNSKVEIWNYEITKHKILLNWINTSNRMSISKRSMDEDIKKGFLIVTKSSLFLDREAK